METNILAIADLDGKDEKLRAIDSSCNVLQTIPANGLSDPQPKSLECMASSDALRCAAHGCEVSPFAAAKGQDGPEEMPEISNPGSPKMGVVSEDKVFVPATISNATIESDSTNGLEPKEENDSGKEWKFDNSLPPIKVRRDDQSCDSSPSDLSPPSPKRMKPGSQERGDQWLGVWNASEKE